MKIGSLLIQMTVTVMLPFERGDGRLLLTIVKGSTYTEAETILFFGSVLE